MLRGGKIEVVLVSSGAISAGTKTMKLPIKPTVLPMRQAISTIGQVALINAYAQVFQKHDIPVGQVLLARTSTTDRGRYLNARNALNALLELGALPIINENDAVATEEILFGDNDQLSANVALLIGAEALVILTDQTGLMTADPAKHPDPHIDERSPGKIRPQVRLALVNPRPAPRPTPRDPRRQREAAELRERNLKRTPRQHGPR